MDSTPPAVMVPDPRSQTRRITPRNSSGSHSICAANTQLLHHSVPQRLLANRDNRDWMGTAVSYQRLKAPQNSESRDLIMIICNCAVMLWAPSIQLGFFKMSDTRIEDELHHEKAGISRRAMPSCAYACRVRRSANFRTPMQFHTHSQCFRC